MDRVRRNTEYCQRFKLPNSQNIGGIIMIANELSITDKKVNFVRRAPRPKPERQDFSLNTIVKEGHSFAGKFLEKRRPVGSGRNLFGQLPV